MLPQTSSPLRARTERAPAGPTPEERRRTHMDLLLRAMNIVDQAHAAVAEERDERLDDAHWPGEVYNLLGGPVGEYAALFTPGVAEAIAGWLGDAHAALKRDDEWNAGHLERSPLYVETVEVSVARHRRAIALAGRIVAAHERREA